MTQTIGLERTRHPAVSAGAGEVALFGTAMLMAAGPLDMFATEYAAVLGLRAAIWGLVYLAFLVLILRHVGTTVAAVFGNWPLALMAGVALLSFLWSRQPQTTIIASLQVGSMVVFGSVIGARLPPGRIALLFCAVMTLAAAGSLVMVVAHPLGIDSNGNAVGLFSHKNALGQRAGVLAIAALALLATRRHRWLPLIALPLAIPLLALSGSRTAWLATTAAVPVVLWFGFARFSFSGRAVTLLAASGAACLLGALLVSGLIDPVRAFFEALDRDTGMSGRVILWELAARYIREAPLFGYGFAGFWANQDPTASSAFVHVVMDQELPHFHNGFIEMVVQLGFLGGVLLIGLLVFLLTRALRLAGRSDGTDGTFALGILAMVLVTSLAEVALIDRHNLNLLLLAALSAQAR